MVIQERRTVVIGSRVEVEDGVLREWWRIVGPEDADAMRRLISVETPLARALLGHQAGEVIQVRGPERRTVTIVHVEPEAGRG